MDNPAQIDEARDPLSIAETWFGEGRAVAVMVLRLQENQGRRLPSVSKAPDYFLR